MSLSWPEPKRGCQVGCRIQFFLCLRVIGVASQTLWGTDREEIMEAAAFPQAGWNFPTSLPAPPSQ